MIDEITDQEIEDIWKTENPRDVEDVRLNGKYVWQTAKRVCDFINMHEDLIMITSFGEYRIVMKKVMMVIKESHNTERKRRHTPRKKITDEVMALRKRAKALIQDIRRKGIGTDEI